MDLAKNPDLVEYIFALNEDDPTLDEKLYEDAGRLVVGKFQGSAAAWDAAAKISRGRVLIQGQDDVEPPEHWDIKLFERVKHLNPDSAFFVRVSDGYRQDALCCTAIMSRAYMAHEGQFLCPAYISVFSDDEVTYRALRHARDGTAYIIDARDLVFLHRHHYHDKSIPFDATYARENSAHAYAYGLRLFQLRNPRASTDGLKTW